MRVLRIKKTTMLPKCILGTLVSISLGVMIGGIVTLNPFLIGGGVAGIILLCGAALGIQRNQQVTLV